MPDSVKVTVETRLIQGRFYHVLLLNGQPEEAYLASAFSLDHDVSLARLSIEHALHGGLRGAMGREEKSEPRERKT